MTTRKDTTRTAIQLSEGKRAALRNRYPGPRGGINWEAVTDAALKGAIYESIAPIARVFEAKDMGSEAGNALMKNLAMVINEYAIQTSLQEHTPRVYVMKSGKKWGFIVYGKGSAVLETQDGFKTEAAAHAAAQVTLNNTQPASKHP
jgi:hypothetical protein